MAFSTTNGVLQNGQTAASWEGSMVSVAPHWVHFAGTRGMVGFLSGQYEQPGGRPMLSGDSIALRANITFVQAMRCAEAGTAGW